MNDIGIMKQNTPKRIDWELIKSNDGKTIFIIPSPIRYERIETDGKVYFKDKFTEDILPSEIVEKIAKATISGTLPIFEGSSKSKSYATYKKIAFKKLKKYWNQKKFQENFPSINEYLIDRVGKETSFVIIYVDLEGSTKFSETLDPNKYKKINKVFLYQMACIIDNYDGYILKFVGDAVIGIFPSEENYLGMCDNSIRAAITMINILENVINPYFLKERQSANVFTLLFCVHVRKRAHKSISAKLILPILTVMIYFRILLGFHN
jgi:hypothetical protein